MEETKKNTFLLSVVIPITRMAGRLQNLELTISNIAKENDIQVILIHDVQDSLTGPNLMEIMEANPEVDFTFVENFVGSPGAARNLAFKHIKGSWVVFVDADDVFTPKSLPRLFSEEHSLKFSAVISNYATQDSRTNLSIQHQHKSSLSQVALQPGIWRWAFKAETIGDCRFSNLSMGEDQKFLYEYCSVSRELHFLEDSTYRYTVNQKIQLTNQKEPKQDLLPVLGEILSIRRSTQTNFDEFTETLLLKLFASSVIYMRFTSKLKVIFWLFGVFSPFSKTRIRTSKIKVASWFRIRFEK